jgi:DNA-binding GntR family transcriptional regulator
MVPFRAMGSRPLRVPSRQVLVDEVYEILRQMVMDKTVSPASRLNIDALARELQVSPTPVREALVRLEADGLVTKRPLTGYSVAPLLDARALSELFEVRHMLEVPAARIAAARITDMQVPALRKLMQEMRGASKGQTYDLYHNFAVDDAEFHNLIARIAGNAVLEETLARLHLHWHLFRLRFGASVAVETIVEHEAIVEAIANRDELAAAEAMANHLRRSQERLKPVSENLSGGTLKAEM